MSNDPRFATCTGCGERHPLRYIIHPCNECGGNDFTMPPAEVPTLSPAMQEAGDLKAIRDDVSKPVEMRIQAAMAYQTYAWFYGHDWATVKPSECILKNLPMIQ